MTFLSVRVVAAAELTLGALGAERHELFIVVQVDPPGVLGLLVGKRLTTALGAEEDLAGRHGRRMPR
jgi:hypothetical protein